MDQLQCRLLGIILRKVSRSLPRLRRARYSDLLIARVYFWALLHDGPMTWALNSVHYTRLFRSRKSPSVSQLNRRIAMQRVHERLTASARSARTYLIGGKSLNVGPCSADRDARSNRIGRGYKLHAVVTQQGQIPMFCVHPLNAHEMPVARVMLRSMGPLSPGTLVLADGNYNAHVLHKDVASLGDGWSPGREAAQRVR